MIESFSANSEWLLAVNYFEKHAIIDVSDGPKNTPLLLKLRFQKAEVFSLIIHKRFK